MLHINFILPTTAHFLLANSQLQSTLSFLFHSIFPLPKPLPPSDYRIWTLWTHRPPTSTWHRPSILRHHYALLYWNADACSLFVHTILHVTHYVSFTNSFFQLNSLHVAFFLSSTTCHLITPKSKFPPPLSHSFFIIITFLCTRKVENDIKFSTTSRCFGISLLPKGCHPMHLLLVVVGNMNSLTCLYGIEKVPNNKIV